MEFDFGVFIKNLRESMGKTQQEFGSDLGVGRAAVNRWENGADIPADEHLPILAKWAGKDDGWLLRRKRIATMMRDGWDVAGFFADEELLRRFGVQLGLGAMGGKVLTDGAVKVKPDTRRVAAMAEHEDWRSVAEFAIEKLDAKGRKIR